MSSQEQRRASGYPGGSAYAEAGDPGEDLCDADSCPQAWICHIGRTTTLLAPTGSDGAKKQVVPCLETVRGAPC